MIKADTSKLEKQLQDYKLEVERKLKYMVAGFASEIAQAASANTPVGDAEALASRPSYRSFYEQRQKNYGIDVDIGFHAGAWKFSPDGRLAFDPNIYAEEQVVSDVFADAKASYTLGSTFYIAAKGPPNGSFGMLENGYSPKAPDGIMQPTINSIAATYAVDLQQYYKRG